MVKIYCYNIITLNQTILEYTLQLSKPHHSNSIFDHILRSDFAIKFFFSYQQ